MTDYPGPERRRDPDDVVRITRREIQEAIETGAHHVGRIHRWKVAATVFAICMLVNGSIGYYAYNDEHQYAKRTLAYQTAAQHQALRTQCGTIAAGRISGNYLRFALRELLSFDTDILTASEHNPHQTGEQRHALYMFLEKEHRRLRGDVRAARKLAPGLPSVSSYQDLFQFFEPAPLVNCQAQIP